MYTSFLLLFTLLLITVTSLPVDTVVGASDNRIK